MKTKQQYFRVRTVSLILGGIVMTCLLSAPDVSAQQRQPQPQARQSQPPGNRTTPPNVTPPQGKPGVVSPAPTASPAVGTDKAEPELIRTVKIPSSTMLNPTSYIAPDGSRYAMPEAGGLTVFDTETGKELYSMKSKTKFCHPVAFSPNGKQIAFGHVGSYTITICNAETGKELFEFIVPEGKKRRVNRGAGRTRPSDDEYGLLYACEVPALKYSANGRRLAMAVCNDPSEEHNSVIDTIIVYDLKTRTIVMSCDLASLEVSLTGLEFLLQKNFAFSPDGKFLAFQCNKGIDNHRNAEREMQIVILEVDTGKIFHKLDRVNQSSLGLCFSPDGKWLMNTTVSTGGDYRTKVFDMKTKKENTIENWLQYPVFSSDSKYLFGVGSSSGMPNPMDMELTGVEIASRKQVYRKKNFLAFPISAASRIYLGIVEAERSTVNTYHREMSLGVYEFPSVDDLAAQLEHTEPGISAPEVDADAGQSVAWKQIREHTVQIGGINNIISPDGKFLATTGDNRGYDSREDKYFHAVLDIATGREVAKFFSGFGTSASFSLDGKEYYLSDDEDKRSRNDVGKLKIYDTSTWKIKRSLDYENSFGVFSSDRRFFICPNSVLDIKTGKSHPLKLPKDDKLGGYDDRFHGIYGTYGNGIDVMPSGKTIIALKSGSGRYENKGLVFYDIASGKKVKELDKLPIQGFCVLPDGKRILATYQENSSSMGRLVVIDLELGEVLSGIGQEHVTSYQVSPDGKYFAVNFASGGLKIFNAATYQSVSTFVVNAFSPVSQIAFSHDSKTLAYAAIEMMSMMENQASDENENRLKCKILLFRAE